MSCSDDGLELEVPHLWSRGGGLEKTFAQFFCSPLPPRVSGERPKAATQTAIHQGVMPPPPPGAPLLAHKDCETLPMRIHNLV